MRRTLCLLGIVPCLAVGCYAEGEKPPWQQPGIGGGVSSRVVESFRDALKETDQEMQMQSDLPPSQRKVDPRPPTAPDD
jgi:hypothetical protein